ncbi:hypothetical protein ACFL1G_04770 [Planctomycetota bacterium]
MNLQFLWFYTLFGILVVGIFLTNYRRKAIRISAIAAAVVSGTSLTGGRATMYGTLIGAVIIGILDKGLNQAGVHFSFQYIVKGLVILGAVHIDVRRRD